MGHWQAARLSEPWLLHLQNEDAEGVYEKPSGQHLAPHLSVLLVSSASPMWPQPGPEKAPVRPDHVAKFPPGALSIESWVAGDAGASC